MTLFQQTVVLSIIVHKNMFIRTLFPVTSFSFALTMEVFLPCHFLDGCDRGTCVFEPSFPLLILTEA